MEFVVNSAVFVHWVCRRDSLADLCSFSLGLFFLLVLFKEINHKTSKTDISAKLGMLSVKSSSMPRSTEEAAASGNQQPPTRNCQVRDHCKKNRSVGRCHKCKNCLCGKCTASIQRVWKGCNRSILAHFDIICHLFSDV
ncbi:unnamed protein product [Clavelina lepadiformis]|uniref:Uncharacterized protein n=1 Tax=Clavelina lepadiformis TaxID=159417 RepID=A0ABP0F1V6_CLALP